MPISNIKRQFRRLRNRNWEGREVPREILLLLSPPRTGSTWFADAIRCHPDVEFWDTSVIFQELGLIGRRYPRDLSEQEGASKAMEVRPGCWEKIPTFDPGDLFDVEVDRHNTRANYAIEKIHPEFYDFNTDTFERNLAKLQKSASGIKILYLVRNPTDSIKSFTAYQKRNPDWYPTTDKAALLAYMDRTYSSILDLLQARDGLVIDYSSMFTDLPHELARVYDFLWPDQGPEQKATSAKASEFAETATNRRLRWKTGTTFLAESTNQVSGGEDLSSTLGSQSGIHLENCIRCYQQLLEQ